MRLLYLCVCVCVCVSVSLDRLHIFKNKKPVVPPSVCSFLHPPVRPAIDPSLSLRCTGFPSWALRHRFPPLIKILGIMMIVPIIIITTTSSAKAVNIIAFPSCHCVHTIYISLGYIFCGDLCEFGGAPVGRGGEEDTDGDKRTASVHQSGKGFLCEMQRETQSCKRLFCLNYFQEGFLERLSFLLHGNVQINCPRF